MTRDPKVRWHQFRNDPLASIKEHAGASARRVSHRLRAGGNTSPRAGAIATSGLFDETWYLERYPAASDTGAIAHYLDVGAAKGNPPHPLFDPAWYRVQAPEALQAGMTPLEHFILHGDAAGLSPHPLFLSGWYRRQRGVPLLVKASPFQHFLHKGGALGISPHPLFDGRGYLDADPLLVAQSVNPLTHFMLCGARQGRWPNPFFDVSWYLHHYRDALPQQANALVHFIQEGAAAGHQIHPDLNLDDYIEANPREVPRDRLAAFEHLVATRGRFLDQSGLASVPAVKSSAAGVRASPAEGTRARSRVHQQWSRIDLDDPAAGLAPDDRPPPVSQPETAHVDHLTASLRHPRAVSFDVWDTLLRRDCHPDEVKLQTARALVLIGGRNVRPQYRNTRAVLEARIVAENAAADNDEFEYRFADAIPLWLRAVLTDDCDEARQREIATTLIEHEIAAERRSTRPDPTAALLLQRLPEGQRRVYASDFYLPAQHLSTILASHGIGRHFESGYVSSDLMLTKRSGRLYDHIVADLALPASSLAHLGDNTKADVDMPRSRGITAHAFVCEAEETRRAWFGTAFDTWRRGDCALHTRRLRAICEDIAARSNSDNPVDRLRAHGARLAPIALGFCLSVIEKAIARGHDVIHFFSREGIFFQRVHETLVAADPFNLPDYPEGRLLRVSRRATFAATLDDVVPRDLMRMWSLYKAQSPKAFAISLNLDPAIVEEASTAVGLAFDTRVEQPWKSRAFNMMIGDPRLFAHARRRIGEQRQLLAQYLAQEGLGQSKRSLVVDIGWRGTIQDALALIALDRQIDGAYLGLFGYLNPQPANAAKSGWLFDDNAGAPLQIGDVAALEMMFNAPGGSVVGYVGEGSRVRPHCEIEPDEERIIRGEVATLQSGMLDAVAPLADYIRLHGLTASDLRPLARDLTIALTTRPPADIADAFMQLRHNESFGMGDAVDVGGRFDASRLDGKLGSPLHAEALATLSASRWKEAAARQSRVKTWWTGATLEARMSVPAEIAIAQAPAVVKARCGKLSVFAPSPLIASGGHRTIFNVVRRLQSIGFDPEIHLEGIGDGIGVVEDYLGGTSATIHTSWRQAQPADVALATIAHSAVHVAREVDAHHKAYLVQDFEALFNPMSDGYLVAENSYFCGLQHCTIGNWLTHLLSIDYGASAFPAGLGVDAALYGRSAGDRRSYPTVTFLYQPDKPRRAPALGIAALRLVKAAMPEVRILLYGSDLPIRLDFEAENLGLVRDLGELAALYARSTVGLCISGTNPSRIPFEMMAAGCIPVDLYRYNNLLDHEAGTILLAHQDAESIADAILTILRDPELAQRVSSAARAHMATRTLAWEADRVANGILAMIEGRLRDLALPALSYRQPPHLAASSRTPAAERFCDRQRQLAERTPTAAKDQT